MGGGSHSLGTETSGEARQVGTGVKKGVDVDLLILQDTGVENFPEQFVRYMIAILQPDHIADAFFKYGRLRIGPCRGWLIVFHN
jgi:hypothetical protein